MVRINNVKEHSTWQNMITRCSGKYSKNKDNSYTRRGITVSEEFKNFKVFLEHVGEAPTTKHTLDRIDNNRGYERGNLRWVTPRENACNRSNTKYYEYQGKLLNIIELEPFLECSIRTFTSRIERGWILEDAMSKSKLQPRRINDTISFDGEEMTITQWSKATCIPARSIYERLNKLGWSIEKTLTTPQGAKKIAFNGKELTISEWAKHLDIPINTLYYRINRQGWSIERVLNALV